MRNYFWFLVFACCLLCSPAYTEKFSIPAVYGKIKDICHPTLKDYRLVQKYLAQDQQDNALKIGDSHYTEGIRKSFKIIGEGPDEIPKFGVINVNCDVNERENCVITYASFNKNFIKGLKRLVTKIKESDFKGHILYRIGGWPNVEDGSLVLAHVPYAFKVCFFKEAEKLGYKRVLWLDTSVIPLVSLNDIFQMIADKNYFAMGNFHTVGPKFINEQTEQYFKLSQGSTNSIPSCSAGLFGVDLTTSIGKSVLDWLYQAAWDQEPFFNPRADQTVLSLILYLSGLHDLVNVNRMPHHIEQINENSLFLVDKQFVHH